MSSVGNNPAFEKVLENASKLMQKKIGFLCEDADPIDYVDNLSLQLKEESGKILFKDKYDKLIYCPCVTKFTKTADLSVPFPNDKRRNPYECAKIQYILCRLSSNTAKTEHIRKNATSFHCNCKDCYKLAMEGVFREGFLCL